MTTRCHTLRTTLQQQVKALVSSGFQRYITLGSGEFAGVTEEVALKILELTAGLGVILMSSPEEYVHRYEQNLWREL